MTIHTYPAAGRFAAFLFCFLISAFGLCSNVCRADLVDIANSSFEDVSGQTSFNEFTFGVPNGWSVFDPNSIIPDPGTYIGTLQPNGVDFFNGPAPDGIRVGILFNSGREGEGVYGFQQQLSTQLEANTRYVLNVEVGNIASGTASNGQFFNLDEFPGYRVELLAGNTVIAVDDDSLEIAEGEFETSTVSLTIGDSHALLGEQLGIRLLNLNQIPDGFTQGTSPDLEVDFDAVTLDATAVPEPNYFIAIGVLAQTWLLFRRPLSDMRRIIARRP